MILRILLFLLIPSVAFGISVIPGAVLFETGSPDYGRGNHTVRTVSNTNASGAGSFQQALLDHNSGGVPSVIVFNTSGIIDPTSGTLYVSTDELIIAGQTAPSPGIEIVGSLLVIRASEVLIQHISWHRDYATDGIRIRDEIGAISNIVLDHVTVGWAGDEPLSISEASSGISYVTIRHTMIHEKLKTDAGGMLIDMQTDRTPNHILIQYNLFAMNYGRNPASKGDEVLIWNNVLYGWGNETIHLANEYNTYSGTQQISIVGNWIIEDADTIIHNTHEPIMSAGIGTGSGDFRAGSEIFLDNNDATTSPVYEYTSGSDPFDHGVSDPVIPPIGLTDKIGDGGLSHAELETWVLANVGSRPADRGTIETDVISQVTDRDGTIKYCIERDSGAGDCDEVGEYAYITRPTLTENSDTFTCANPNDDDDSDGYTNLEECLHDYLELVEVGEALEDPPELASVTIPVLGTTVIMNFNADITESGTGSDWTTFTMTAGGISLSSPSVSGDEITYTLSRTVVKNEQLIELDYTQPGDGIEDDDDVDLVSINNYSGSFTNNSTVIIMSMKGIKIGKYDF